VVGDDEDPAKARLAEQGPDLAHRSVAAIVHHESFK
jgi:hypothetical protein